jgi:hypothetical protein
LTIFNAFEIPHGKIGSAPPILHFLLPHPAWMQVCLKPYSRVLRQLFVLATQQLAKRFVICFVFPGNQIGPHDFFRHVVAFDHGTYLYFNIMGWVHERRQRK